MANQSPRNQSRPTAASAPRSTGTIADTPLLSLDDMLDMDATAWKPEPGSKLTGMVIRLDMAGEDSPYGSYPLLIVQPDGETRLVAIHAFHTVLRREVARQGVGSGDRIGVKYFGRVEHPPNPPFEHYRLINWSAITQVANKPAGQQQED